MVVSNTVMIRELYTGITQVNRSFVIYFIGRIFFVVVFGANAFLPSFRSKFSPFAGSINQFVCLVFSIMMEKENFSLAIINYSFQFTVNVLQPVLLGIDFRVYLFLELPLGIANMIATEYNFWGIITREKFTNTMQISRAPTLIFL